MKATPVEELVAGVRTREPDCCMITASVPPTVVRSLKVETGAPELGPVLGAALGATEGGTLTLGIGALGATEGMELGPMEGLRLSGLTFPVGEAEG